MFNSIRLRRFHESIAGLLVEKLLKKNRGLLSTASSDQVISILFPALYLEFDLLLEIQAVIAGVLNHSGG